MKLGLQNKDASNIINDKMKQRFNVVCEAILQYCINWLEIETSAGLMGLEGGEDVYCTILYNDESHTYEQVCFFFVIYFLFLVYCRHCAFLLYRVLSFVYLNYFTHKQLLFHCI